MTKSILKTRTEIEENLKTDLKTGVEDRLEEKTNVSWSDDIENQEKTIKSIIITRIFTDEKSTIILVFLGCWVNGSTKRVLLSEYRDNMSEQILKVWSILGVEGCRPKLFDDCVSLSLVSSRIDSRIDSRIERQSLSCSCSSTGSKRVWGEQIYLYNI